MNILLVLYNLELNKFMGNLRLLRTHKYFLRKELERLWYTISNVNPVAIFKGNFGARNNPVQLY